MNQFIWVMFHDVVFNRIYYVFFIVFRNLLFYLLVNDIQVVNWFNQKSPTMV